MMIWPCSLLWWRSNHQGRKDSKQQPYRMAMMLLRGQGVLHWMHHML